ncbi:MAG: T9SS type A sorting domain-containing protein [Calditrichaeota bacterium]|nr:T9SS type A sorting domain-containing protein [Calditrichota bacterium]
MTSVNSRTEPGIPAYSCLEPAYPNPFNSTTRISYDLASVSDVRITIHDLTGREITEIVNAQQSAGSYITIWNAENITAGVYLVKMEASDFTNVSKLVLVK